MLSQHAEAEATYDRYLADLQGWVGWFALVRGEKLGGIFPTYEAAAAAWMGLYGPVPALIRRIEKVAVQPGTPTVPVQTISPSDAQVRLAVSRAWTTTGGDRAGPHDFAA